MPQTSPMKWMLLNVLSQCSMIQIVSLMSYKKMNANSNKLFEVLINKIHWKW